MTKAEVISIGDELLSGETVDTNANLLDHFLAERGYQVQRHTTVADHIDDIADAMTAAAARVPLVLCTGGLGPTQDDLTLAAMAKALDCPMREDAHTLARIEARFRGLGRTMSPNNRRQAQVPAQGTVLDNDAGTAPGFQADLHGAQFFLMPGVPREVRWFLRHALPNQIPMGGDRRVRRILRVFGLGESRLEHEVRALIDAHPQVRVGFRAQGYENHIKLFGAADDVDRLWAEAKALLGTRALGAEDRSLAAVVGAACEAAGRTIAVAESCTGGALGAAITAVPGASAYFLGGLCCYANQAKMDVLGVPEATLAAHGAVSEPVALAMARGALTRLGADVALATTGIAGPAGGTEDKPVGTVWIAVAQRHGDDASFARCFRFPGDRTTIRDGAVMAALDLCRRALAA